MVVLAGFDPISKPRHPLADRTDHGSVVKHTIDVVLLIFVFVFGLGAMGFTAFCLWFDAREKRGYRE